MENYYLNLLICLGRIHSLSYDIFSKEYKNKQTKEGIIFNFYQKNKQENYDLLITLKELKTTKWEIITLLRKINWKLNTFIYLNYFSFKNKELDQKIKIENKKINKNIFLEQKFQHCKHNCDWKTTIQNESICYFSEKTNSSGLFFTTKENFGINYYGETKIWFQLFLPEEYSLYCNYLKTISFQKEICHFYCIDIFKRNEQEKEEILIKKIMNLEENYETHAFFLSSEYEKFINILEFEIIENHNYCLKSLKECQISDCLFISNNNFIDLHNYRKKHNEIHKKFIKKKNQNKKRRIEKLKIKN